MPVEAVIIDPVTGKPALVFRNEHGSGLQVKVIDQDTGLAISRGLVPGVSCVKVFGRNPSIAAGWEDIWDVGGAYTGFLLAPVQIRIAAGGNVADDAAGAGARSVIVSGIGIDWRYVEERFVTAGAAASATSTAFFNRVSRIYVEHCGTYGGNNTGTVTIESVPAGTVLCSVPAGKGQSRMAIYTIPDGHTGYLVRLAEFVDGGKTGNMELWVRNRADLAVAPFEPVRSIHQTDGLIGRNDVPLTLFEPLPARSDIWMSAYGAATNPAIGAEFDIILVENTVKSL